MNLAAGSSGCFQWAPGPVGLSTLFFDTVLHTRSDRLSLQWTPLWAPSRQAIPLRIEPISLHVAMPILSGIPLIVPQYRPWQVGL